jgi:hypothetical protein
VNARDQRDRQQLHEAQELDAVEPAAFTALIDLAGRDPLVEDIEIGAGREMP